MKKLLLILLCLPFIGFGQQTDYELEFDSAAQDYVEILNMSSYISNKTAFSISGWLYLKSNAINTIHSGFMGFRNDLDADFYLLQLDNTSDIEARFRNSSGTKYDIIVINGLSFNQWQHLAFTYDGSYIRLYKNGFLLDSTAANGVITQTNQSLRLGSLDWQGTEFHMSGRLDEIRLWDVTISQPEINNWMCTEVNSFHPDYNNLIGYWRLNTGFGVTIYDQINGNNGMFINSPIWNISTSCLGSNGLGCTDTLACNYDSLATIDDSSCVYPVIWQHAFSICNGDSIVVGSSVYDTAGYYTDTLNASNGCDSILYTNISITPPIIWQQAFSICNGDSIVVGSSVYDTTGVYTDTLNASNGCDSIVYTNISIMPYIIWQQAFSICDGDSIVVGSSVYDTAGYYTDTLNASNGCDTIMYTNIFLVYQHTSSYDTLSVTASIVWNGIPISVSGDYSVTLTNSVGCDSIVNLNLTINPTGLLNITNTEKTLFKVTDLLGRETKGTKNEVLFYIYDDGTVEKRITIE